MRCLLPACLAVCCSALAFTDAGTTLGAEDLLTQPLLSPHESAAADAAEAGVPLLLEKDEPNLKEEAHK